MASYFGKEINSWDMIEPLFYIKDVYTIRQTCQGLKIPWEMAWNALMTCFSLKRLTSWWHSSRVVALLVLLKHQLKGKILRFFWSSTWPERNWNYFGSYHLIKVKEKYFTDLYVFSFISIWYFYFDCFFFHNLPYHVIITPSNNRKITISFLIK